jgi:hypothetical protein
MTPGSLLLAAALRVLIPSFTVDHAPGVLGQRLPDFYAAALDASGCASSTPAVRLGAQTISEIASCEGNSSCLASVGKILGVDFILLGTVSRHDDNYGTSLALIDVRERRLRKHLEASYSGMMKGLEASVAETIPALCHEIDPTWTPPKTQTAEDKLADLQFDLGPQDTPAAPPPAPPTPVAQNDSPPLPDFDLPPPPDEPEQKPAPVVVAVNTPAPPTPPPEVKPPPVAAAPAPVALKPAPVIAAVTPARPPVAVKPAPAVVVTHAPPKGKETPPEKYASRAASRPSVVLGFIPAPTSRFARNASYVALGAAGGAAILGGIFGEIAFSAAKQRLNAPDVNNFNNAQASAQARGTAANVAFAVAGTAAVTSLVIWLAGDHLFSDAHVYGFKLSP